ncbi:unnamed protein product [marine sediment metagenome]|uniref:CARDB domain-containing protein n=1 Tax=marine sediment metagenome TaxID=412755 RepID=X1PYC8_9ZZZZ
MAEQSVTLTPGESKAISFEATPHEARSYQVSVNGLAGSFSAVGAPPDIPVGFTISSLTITPKTVGIGYSVTISVIAVDTTGAASPPYDFYFHIDGEVLKRTYVYPWGIGTARGISATYTPTEVRTYQVKINGRESSFAVTKLPDVRLTNLPREDLSPVTPVYGGRIRLSNFTIEPGAVHIGENVTISVIVANYHRGGAGARIHCTVDHHYIEQQMGFAAGERKLVSFWATPYKAKTFSVDVNDLTGSFKAILSS